MQKYKKAVTDDDERTLLDRIYKMDNIFGTPVHFLRPESFRAPYLGETIDKLFLSQQIKNRSNVEIPKDAITSMASRISGVFYEFTTNIASVYRVFPNTHPQNADLYSPDNYSQPTSATILAPPKNLNWSNFLQSTLSIKAPDMPEHSKKMQFMHLVHELGHAIGGGEPQAEAFMTTMSKLSYNDSMPLTCFADFRAIKGIFDGVNRRDSIASPYGWGMVESNDYIRNLDNDTIHGLSKTEIKEIRFQKFNHHNVDIIKAANEICRIEEKPFKTIRNSAPQYAADALKPLCNAAEIVKKDNKTTDARHQILTRFQLACQRISIGTPAYERPKDFIDPDILESERAQPITFTPGEYIPE